MRLQAAFGIVGAIAGTAMAAACEPAAPPAVVEDRLPPSPITLRALADGTIALDGVTVSREDLPRRFAEIAAMDPQPEVRIEPEAGAPYDAVAHAMAAAQRAGVMRMGVIGGT